MEGMNSYIGAFVEGKRTGRGVFYWPDGEKFEGEFLNDLREGSGSYYWVNGNMIHGNWKGENLSGVCHFEEKNGWKFSAIFEEGISISATSFIFAIIVVIFSIPIS